MNGFDPPGAEGQGGGGGNPPPEDPPGPELEDFVNDPEIREMYADPEVSAAFTEIENDPATIATHYQNPKIKRVLTLIQKKFDPYLPQQQQMSEEDQIRLLQQQTGEGGFPTGDQLQGLGQFAGQLGQGAQMEAILNMFRGSQGAGSN